MWRGTARSCQYHVSGTGSVAVTVSVSGSPRTATTTLITFHPLCISYKIKSMLTSITDGVGFVWK